jgi:hypothetical protein
MAPDRKYFTCTSTCKGFVSPPLAPDRKKFTFTGTSNFKGFVKDGAAEVANAAVYLQMSTWKAAPSTFTTVQQTHQQQKRDDMAGPDLRDKVANENFEILQQTALSPFATLQTGAGSLCDFDVTDPELQLQPILQQDRDPMPGPSRQCEITGGSSGIQLVIKESEKAQEAQDCSILGQHKSPMPGPSRQCEITCGNSGIQLLIKESEKAQEA